MARFPVIPVAMDPDQQQDSSVPGEVTSVFGRFGDVAAQSGDYSLGQITGSSSVVTATSTVGHPTTGTWTAGQAIVDGNGDVWTCTVSGTPGTWVEGASGGSVTITSPDSSITVGGTGSAPTLEVEAAIQSGAAAGATALQSAEYQTVEINGTAKTQRGKLNLIPGTNVTIGASDNSGANSTDVTINSSAGGLPSGGSVGQVVTNTGSGAGDWEWPFSSFIRISDHGAKGDCKFGAQCTTVANNTTVTCSDASFVSGDVGKTIVINGACNGTSGGSWATTISSVTDSTHVVVASAPTKAVSNLSYAYGTDDTTAFNNAITAGQALNVGRWTLLLDDVAYMIAGSLVTTNDYNTQIPLPYITSASSRVTIEIRGKSLRPAAYLATGNSNWTNTPTGPILFSSLTNQAVGGGNPYSSSVGLQSMIGGIASAGPASAGTFTQVCPVFRGITFLGPHWPGGVLTDTGGCQQAVYEDCLWATNEPDSVASPGWRTNAACIMPLYNNNGVCQMKGVNTSINHAIGFVLGEHSSADKLYVYQAQAGITFPTWQNQSAISRASHIHTQACINHISGWDPGNVGSYGVNSSCTAYFEVGAWHIEGYSVGNYIATQHVNCGNNFYMDADVLSSDTSTSNLLSPGRPRLRALGVAQGAFAPPSLPSSGTAFTQVWRDTMYVFSGGTVSSITVGGTNVNTSGSVLVPAGYKLVVNYSAAPTISAYTVL